MWHDKPNASMSQKKTMNINEYNKDKNKKLATYTILTLGCITN